MGLDLSWLVENSLKQLMKILRSPLHNQHQSKKTFGEENRGDVGGEKVGRKLKNILFSNCKMGYFHAEVLLKGLLTDRHCH